MKRLPALALPILLVLGLVACSPAAESSGESPSTGFGGDDASSPAPSDRPLSPLAAFQAEIYGLDVSAEEREERDLARSVEIEDLTAACMKDEGFDYTPQPHAPDYTDGSRTFDGISDADLDDRAWVTRYGYGIVETPDRAMGQSVDGSGRGKDATDDPNKRYRDSLSESERTAYELALSGREPTDAELEDGWSLADAGCSGRSRVAVEGEDPGELPEHQPVLEAMVDFYNTFTSWEGLAELQQSWAGCMAGRGRAGYADPSKARDEIAQDYAGLWAAANPEPVERAEPQTSPPIDALTALAAIERELALIDLDCREEIHYLERYDAIVAAEEERFMADHKPALDALRAAYEQRNSR